MKELTYTIVIPARYASSRFPGKPLHLLNGKPMILHTVARARESAADAVVVATDDERILQVCADAESFETPFGPVPVDLAALTGIPVDADAHAKEYALEVHLPFLRILFPDTAIAPLLVGEAAPETVAEHLMALGCGDDGVLTVISSDLAHYLPVEQLRITDRETLRLIEAGDYGALGVERACAAPALKGLGVVAQRLGLRAAALDLSDSTATTGANPQSAVGYAAIAYYGADKGSAP